MQWKSENRWKQSQANKAVIEKWNLKFKKKCDNEKWSAYQNKKRMKRFELSTLSLARRCSTTELHPRLTFRLWGPSASKACNTEGPWVKQKGLCQRKKWSKGRYTHETTKEVGWSHQGNARGWKPYKAGELGKKALEEPSKQRGCGFSRVKIWFFITKERKMVTWGNWLREDGTNVGGILEKSEHHVLSRTEITVGGGYNQEGTKTCF